MATYVELYGLFEDATLLSRVEVAVLVAAHQILVDPVSTNPQIAWAQQAIRNSASISAQMFHAVLAGSKEFTVAQIEATTDEALQDAVDLVVPSLAHGFGLAG